MTRIQIPLIRVQILSDHLPRVALQVQDLHSNHSEDGDESEHDSSGSVI